MRIQILLLLVRLALNYVQRKPDISTADFLKTLFDQLGPKFEPEVWQALSQETVTARQFSDTIGGPSGSY